MTIEDFVKPEPKETPINRDGYYRIIATQGDSKFTIYSPGYWMKSWLAFENKLGYTVKYEECTKGDWEKYLWGTKL